MIFIHLEMFVVSSKLLEGKPGTVLSFWDVYIVLDSKKSKTDYVCFDSTTVCERDNRQYLQFNQDSLTCLRV